MIQISFNKVTWYSKLLAIVLFVGTFLLAFYLGNETGKLSNTTNDRASEGVNSTNPTQEISVSKSLGTQTQHEPIPGTDKKIATDILTREVYNYLFSQKCYLEDCSLFYSAMSDITETAVSTIDKAHLVVGGKNYGLLVAPPNKNEYEEDSTSPGPVGPVRLTFVDYTNSSEPFVAQTLYLEGLMAWARNDYEYYASISIDGKYPNNGFLSGDAFYFGNAPYNCVTLCGNRMDIWYRVLFDKGLQKFIAQKPNYTQLESILNKKNITIDWKKEHGIYLGGFEIFTTTDPLTFLAIKYDEETLTPEYIVSFEILEKNESDYRYEWNGLDSDFIQNIKLIYNIDSSLTLEDVVGN